MQTMACSRKMKVTVGSDTKHFVILQNNMPSRCVAWWWSLWQAEGVPVPFSSFLMWGCFLSALLLSTKCHCETHFTANTVARKEICKLPGINRFSEFICLNLCNTLAIFFWWFYFCDFISIWTTVTEKDNVLKLPTAVNLCALLNIHETLTVLGWVKSEALGLKTVWTSFAVVAATFSCSGSDLLNVQEFWNIPLHKTVSVQTHL